MRVRLGNPTTTPKLKGSPPGAMPPNIIRKNPRTQICFIEGSFLKTFKSPLGLSLLDMEIGNAISPSENIFFKFFWFILSIIPQEMIVGNGTLICCSNKNPCEIMVTSECFGKWENFQNFP